MDTIRNPGIRKDLKKYIVSARRYWAKTVRMVGDISIEWNRQDRQEEYTKQE